MYDFIQVFKQAVAGAAASFVAAFPASALIADLGLAKAALIGAIAAGFGVLAGGLGNLIKQFGEKVRGL
jgi:hypothetical protein